MTNQIHFKVTIDFPAFVLVKASEGSMSVSSSFLYREEFKVYFYNVVLIIVCKHLEIYI